MCEIIWSTFDDGESSASPQARKEIGESINDMFNNTEQHNFPSVLGAEWNGMELRFRRHFFVFRFMCFIFVAFHRPSEPNVLAGRGASYPLSSQLTPRKNHTRPGCQGKQFCASDSHATRRHSNNRHGGREKVLFRP